MKCFLVLDPNGTPNPIEVQHTQYTDLIAKKFLNEFPYPKLSAGTSEPEYRYLDSRQVKESVSLQGHVETQTDYDALKANIRTSKNSTYGAAADIYIVSNDAEIKASGSYSTASPWSNAPTVTHLQWKTTDTSGGAHMIRFRCTVVDIEDELNTATSFQRYNVELELVRGVKLA